MLRRQKILEFLKEGARTAEEIAIFFIGSSVARVPGFRPGIAAVRQLRRERWRDNYDEEYERLQRKRVQRVIQSLRVDGLIKSEGSGKKTAYISTPEGDKWLLKRARSTLPAALREKEFIGRSSSTTTIVTYDIPDHLRQYRDWLRQRLLQLGFSMLQRSVFIGKVTMPEELILELSNHHILDCVEIFEISKRGTLRLLGQRKTF